jgi:lipopolysaccharide export LptBFGC system permease protein LptF
MFILDRYIAGRFVRALTFSLLVLLVIYVIANLVENLDQFLDAQATTMQVVRYYVNFLPFIIVLMLPVAILLAVLFSMGALSKNNELVAMRASGVPLLRTARPLLGLGLLLSLN